MATKAKSVRSSRRSKHKGSTLGRPLVASLKEALAHSRGEIALPSYTVRAEEPVEAARLRGR